MSLASLVAARVPAQQGTSAGELERQAAEIRQRIAELEDILNRIVEEGHVLVEWGAAVVLVERERVENLRRPPPGRQDGPRAVEPTA